MASTSFARVFSLRVVRQFVLAEGREKMTDWMEAIVSDEVMQQAYECVCQSRRDDSANDDVWDLPHEIRLNHFFRPKGPAVQIAQSNGLS
jgi:hypothetical protein